MLSMTGYGVGTAQEDEILVVTEIRTGNHRFLDLHIRVTKDFGFLEPEVQGIVRSRLRRGRVDLNVLVQVPPPVEMLINSETARNYVDAVGTLKEDLALEDTLDLATLLNLPGVLRGREINPSQQGGNEGSRLSALVGKSVDQALEDVLRMRRREGGQLQADMRLHLDSVRREAESIAALIPETTVEHQRKLEERIAQLVPALEVDQQRLAQEVALLVDKSDITEETTRLRSHLDQFSVLMDSEHEVGKKMDFLLQEMHRETNTTLAKTQNLEITRLGLSIKAGLEKLREQVQNVE